MTAPYRDRRRRVLERLGEDGALLLVAAPELRIGPDTDVRYVPDAELFWLTGYSEPRAVLLLRGSVDGPRFNMFVRPRDPDRELWTGPRGGVEAAVERFGAEAAYPLTELDERLPALLRDTNTLYARPGQGSPEFDQLVLALLATGRRTRPRRGRGIHTLRDPGVLLDPLRRTKDAWEVARIREAAEITVAAFSEAAKQIRPGAGEWQIEAALDAGFRGRGGFGPAFPTIVAGGANATTLHYIANDRPLSEGELVLIDAGARKSMYCADISRTFPVSGAFTPEQRQLYEVVLAAHDRAIEAVHPGATVADVHGAALRALLEGLRELGCVAGEIDALVVRPAEWNAWYPHRTSHWLGLDVHDAGAYVERGRDTALQPGMVLTVEPGLYFPAGDDRCPPALRGTGVRIEDDVLVTVTGREVLTDALPADADGILDLMS